MGFESAGNSPIDLGLVANIAMQVEGAEFGRQRLAGRVSHIGDHDLRAFARETPRAGLTDALCATGDEADPALQAK
jgi:hypothetical protein